MTELYIASGLALDRLAPAIADRLEGPLAPRHIRLEWREGANRGGRYVILHGLAAPVVLLRNAGDAEVEERADFSYYAFVESDDPAAVEATVRPLCRALEEEGLQHALDDLTS